jgi:hypothetical protein
MELLIALWTLWKLLVPLLKAAWGAKPLNGIVQAIAIVIMSAKQNITLGK